MTADDVRRTAPEVLVVDDQEENLQLVEEILSPEGYAVTTARDGEEALRAVEARPPDCIVLDIMMPRLDGFDVCRRLKARRKTCFIPVVMLTALSDVSDKVEGLEAGADDFLSKPVNASELKARVRSLLKVKRLRDELETSESVIFTMVQALDLKDPVGAGHSERVAIRAINLARRLGLGDAQVEVVAKGAMLHDLGKIGVPDSVLWPSACLRQDEEQLFRTHARLGCEILEPLRSLSHVREVVLHHHERLDGSGYPAGLKGEAFTPAVEVVALTNHFDNLVYQEGSEQAAMATLRSEGAAGAFHPEIVEALAEVLRSGEEPPGDPRRWQEHLPVPVALAPAGKILAADDTPASREVIRDILTSAGHEVVCVESGLELLACVDDVDPDLVVVDIRMPGMDGFTVCERLKARGRGDFLPVILVTAYTDASDRRLGATAGADDFILLPINRMELRARVKSLARLRFFVRDLEEHRNVFMALASALEAKDPYTNGHSAAVGALAVRLARKLGLGEKECELLGMAGRLHDLGKIGMPESLLNKPGKLTAMELKTVQRHPVSGEQILSHLQTEKAILPMIRHHHERFDGSGYPDRLKGEAIPLGARILGLVDAYEAMISARPYRERMSPREVMRVLEDETAEGRWDPALFKAFREVMAT